MGERKRRGWRRFLLLQSGRGRGLARGPAGGRRRGMPRRQGGEEPEEGGDPDGWAPPINSGGGTSAWRGPSLAGAAQAGEGGE